MLQLWTLLFILMASPFAVLAEDALVSSAESVAMSPAMPSPAVSSLSNEITTSFRLTPPIHFLSRNEMVQTQGGFEPLSTALFLAANPQLVAPLALGVATVAGVPLLY